MMKSLTTVVFDLDSTLCRYQFTVAEVLEQALVRCGFASDRFGPIDVLADGYNAAWWAAEETVKASTEELRRRAWIGVLEQHGLAEVSVARDLADAYSEIRKETGLEFFPEVEAFLADLRVRYRTGILTNGPSDMQWEKLRDLDLVVAVDAIVVAGDLGFFKPDPRPFRRVLELLETEPSDAVYIGDSFEHDIVGAHGVGMQTVWVTPDGALHEGDVVPDAVVERATDLREALL